MSEPKLNFFYNSTSNETPYAGTGLEDEQWKYITVSGAVTDRKIFTGGGINNGLTTPTAPWMSRDATIRPIIDRIPIPQTFIEPTSSGLMHHVPLAGRTTGRYVFAIYVDGELTSDLYLEAWDDNNFISHDLPVLSGTTTYPDSMVNAISTTDNAPPYNWSGVTLSGGIEVPPVGTGVCLRGSDSRVRLKGTDNVQDEALYYNMFIYLPYDAPLFHNQPVEAFRYLYI